MATGFRNATPKDLPTIEAAYRKFFKGVDIDFSSSTVGFYSDAPHIDIRLPYEEYVRRSRRTRAGLTLKTS